MESDELRDFTSVQKHWVLVFLTDTLVEFEAPGCVIGNGDDNQIKPLGRDGSYARRDLCAFFLLNNGKVKNKYSKRAFGEA